MSLALTRWAWSLSLSPTNKLVLLALADCCNGGQDLNTCWPSMVHLTTQTGLSLRSVQRALRDLEQLCLIASQPGSGKRSSTYTLSCTDTKTLPLDLAQPASRGATVTPLTASRGATVTGEGCHTVTPGVSPCHPRGATLTGEGCHCVAQGCHSDTRTENEPEEKNSSLRESRHFAAPKGEISRSLTDPLALPDWQGIAQAIRPDIGNPSDSWEKFCDFYSGGTDVNARTTAEWEFLWRKWISREYKKRSTRYNRNTASDRPPGSFITDLATDAIPASYERVQ